MCGSPGWPRTGGPLRCGRERIGAVWPRGTRVGARGSAAMVPPGPMNPAQAPGGAPRRAAPGKAATPGSAAAAGTTATAAAAGPGLRGGSRDPGRGEDAVHLLRIKHGEDLDAAVVRVQGHLRAGIVR